MFSKDQQTENAAMLDMDIQQEEVLSFFRDYWQSILAIAVALVVLTAGLQVYRAWDARVSGQQTAELLVLSEAPATDANAKALEDFAAHKATGNRRVLTWLYAAGKYEILNKPDDVKRMLDNVAKSGAPDAVRDYARVLLANGGDAAALGKIGQNSPWQPAAQELRALAETDAQKRRDLYGEIASDPKSPQAMRGRAAEFSGQPAAVQ